MTSWRDSGRGVAPPVGDAAGIAPGDFVANERDFPSVDIEDCSVEDAKAENKRISEEMTALAVGNINVFFDMPADLDISQAAVNIVE